MAEFLFLPVDLWLQRKELIFAFSHSNLKELLQIFQRTSISSLPIWGNEQKKWIGIIDMLDIIEAHNLLSSTSNLVDFQQLLQGFGCSNLTAEQIVKKSPRSQNLIVVCPGESLITSMKYLTEIHKILIGPNNSSDPKSFCLLTQMDIVKQLSKMDLEDRKRKIEEIFPFTKVIYSIKEDDIARNAFQLMYKRKLGALAIVNNCDTLISNISTSDLKMLDSDNIGNIILQVKQFLEIVHGEKAAVPVVCKPLDRLEDILSKILIAKIHRIWITNSAEQPIGVITLTDIIKFLGSVSTSM